MKVIQTHYAEHYFRSRLEARYAVFFDALNETWEYEKEGYDLDDGDWYLPDFWLPRIGCYVEIKGQHSTKDEIRKCRKLQFYTGNDVVIFNGLPAENYGLWFAWDDEYGKAPIESLAMWTIDDGFLTLADTPNGGSYLLKKAATQAKRARFEYCTSYPNIVDYDRIPF